MLIPVIAAKHLGVGCPNRESVPTHDHLQQVFIHLHHHLGDLLIGREEDQGVEGHFELRTDPDEGAAHRLHQVLPAELQVQDMVVLIWLSTQHTENI